MEVDVSCNGGKGGKGGKAETVRFSYTLYITRCSARRGLSDTRRGSKRRLEIYGGGIRENAVAVATHFPGAAMWVHVPADELLEGTVTEPLLRPFLEGLVQDHPHVRVVTFGMEEVGGHGLCDSDDSDDSHHTTRKTRTTLKQRMARMTLGQRLRCSRYLPMFCGEGEDEDFVPVVARDADSILSPLDAALIQRWLREGVRWLIYQYTNLEERASRVLGALGGGLACAAPMGSPERLREAIASCSEGERWDEDMLETCLPSAFAARAREGAVTWGDSSLGSCMVVATRLTTDGTWYTWDASTCVEELLWPVVAESLHDYIAGDKWVR